VLFARDAEALDEFVLRVDPLLVYIFAAPATRFLPGRLRIGHIPPLDPLMG